MDENFMIKAWVKRVVGKKTSRLKKLNKHLGRRPPLQQRRASADRARRGSKAAKHATEIYIHVQMKGQPQNSVFFASTNII
jgi:hypothetical protein